MLLMVVVVVVVVLVLLLLLLQLTETLWGPSWNPERMPSVSATDHLPLLLLLLLLCCSSSSSSIWRCVQQVAQHPGASLVRNWGLLEHQQLERSANSTSVPRARRAGSQRRTAPHEWRAVTSATPLDFRR